MKRKPRFADESWAVFNNHVNNAGKRALRICRLRYEKTDQELLDLEAAAKNGIMAIFQSKPNPVTQMYANACFIFANKLDK